MGKAYYVMTIKPNKNGIESVALKRTTDKEYHFWYLLDQTRWDNQAMLITVCGMNSTARILCSVPENIRQNRVFRRGHQDYFDKGSDLKTHLCYGGFEDQWIHA
jgi:hypothetical protein